MKSIIENTIRKDAIFMVLDKADLTVALKNLNGWDLKVYLAMMSNQDGYTTEHLAKSIGDMLGLKKLNHVYESLKNLKDMGYIIESENIQVCRSYAGSRPDNFEQPKVSRKKTAGFDDTGKAIKSENRTSPKTEQPESENGTSPKTEQPESENGTKVVRNQDLTSPKIGLNKSENGTTNNTDNTNKTDIIHCNNTVNFAATRKYDYSYDDDSEVDTSDVPF